MLTAQTLKGILWNCWSKILWPWLELFSCYIFFFNALTLIARMVVAKVITIIRTLNALHCLHVIYSFWYNFLPSSVMMWNYEPNLKFCGRCQQTTVSNNSPLLCYYTVALLLHLLSEILRYTECPGANMFSFKFQTMPSWEENRKSSLAFDKKNSEQKNSRNPGNNSEKGKNSL